MIAQLTELATRCLCALPLWVLVRGAWWLLRRPGRIRPMREAALCLFAVFMAGMLYMALEGEWIAPGEMLRSAVERIRTGEKIHLIPFQTIRPQLDALPDLNALAQLLGNTLLFAPWGFFLPLLWRRFRRPLRMVGMALALTGFIECTQLFIDRFFEVDDLLLNSLGSMTGAGLWWCLHHFWPQMDGLLLHDN